MSLASDYAASQAAQATPPAPFVGLNGRAEVTPSGNLRLVQTGSGVFEIPPAAALAFRDWLTATFG